MAPVRVAVILPGALALAGLPAAAQTLERELAALREHLKLPAAVALAPAESLALPPANPLRAHLATGLDLKTRENLERWIAEWNAKDGKRRGVIELLPAAAGADIVLARYTEPDKARTRTVAGADLFPAAPGTTRSGSRPRFTFEMVPVYAYVIDARRPESWSILWRYAGQTPREESKTSGRELWDGLRELLRERE
jgi:hypothetical protein